MWEKYLLDNFSFIKKVLKENGSEVWGIELPDFIPKMFNTRNISIKDNNISLYIHVPFCYQKCSYCGEHGENNVHKFGSRRYVDLLIKELYILSKNNNFEKKTISSLSMGGGTPTLLEGEDILLLMEEIKKYFIIDKNTELTIETVPNRINLKLAKYIKKSGFNRVSIGVQSFNENTLKKVGRMQKNISVYKAFEVLREVGLDNISIDLIIGLDNEDQEVFIEESINHIKKLSPSCINLFSLQSKKKDINYNLPFVNNQLRKFYKTTNSSKYTKDRRIEQKDLLGLGCGANGQVNISKGFYTYKKITKNLFKYEIMINKGILLYRNRFYSDNLQLKKNLIRSLRVGFDLEKFNTKKEYMKEELYHILKRINQFVIDKGAIIKIDRDAINKIKIGNSFDEKYFVFWFLYIFDEEERNRFKEEIVYVGKNIV